MASNYNETTPVVQTTHGKVRGTLLKGIYEDQFYAFDGIPYAAPPLENLRFKEPLDIEPWEGIRDCTKPLSKCIQVSSYTNLVEGSEDCLYLNISAKTLHSEKPLPVMVFIHGGLFKGGDSSRRAWGPDYFMREDVIHVSIGHRLGPLGFVSFADPSLKIPGNTGLKDIIMALRWIKANSSNFNGDPDRITLFGHSSGSMLCQMLLASPQTEGLFHKAVLMAGISMEVNSLPQVEYRLAKHLGYAGENVDSQVLDFLLRADAHLIVSADFLTPVEKGHGNMAFKPSIESYVTPNAVLLAEPIELQHNSWSNRIPIILGANKEEGLINVTTFKTNPKVLQMFQEYPDQVLPNDLKNHCDSVQKREMGLRTLEYFCKAHGQELNLDHFDSLAEIFTHNAFHLLDRFVKARLAFGQAPTYVYRFAFDSPDFNFYRIRYFGKGQRGVCHVDELGYIYVLPATFKLDRSRPEFSTIWRMVSMLVHFAATSDPNSHLTKPLVDWKPASSGTLMVLNITEELKFVPLSMPKLKFHDHMFEQAGVALF